MIKQSHHQQQKGGRKEEVADRKIFVILIADEEFPSNKKKKKEQWEGNINRKYIEEETGIAKRQSKTDTPGIRTFLSLHNF